MACAFELVKSSCLVVTCPVNSQASLRSSGNAALGYWSLQGVNFCAWDLCGPNVGQSGPSEGFHEFLCLRRLSQREQYFFLAGVLWKKTGLARPGVVNPLWLTGTMWYPNIWWLRSVSPFLHGNAGWVKTHPCVSWWFHMIPSRVSTFNIAMEKDPENSQENCKISNGQLMTRSRSISLIYLCGFHRVLGPIFITLLYVLFV